MDDFRPRFDRRLLRAAPISTRRNANVDEMYEREVFNAEIEAAGMSRGCAPLSSGGPGGSEGTQMGTKTELYYNSFLQSAQKVPVSL